MVTLQISSNFGNAYNLEFLLNTHLDILFDTLFLTVQTS